MMMMMMMRDYAALEKGRKYTWVLQHHADCHSVSIHPQKGQLGILGASSAQAPGRLIACPY